MSLFFALLILFAFMVSICEIKLSRGDGVAGLALDSIEKYNRNRRSPEEGYALTNKGQAWKDPKPPGNQREFWV